VKILLDEHYSPAIAAQLSAAGYTADTVLGLGLAGEDDQTLLEFCERESYALLTNNVRDFVPLARQWAADGREHAGLVFTSDASLPRHSGTIGQFVTLLSALLTEQPSERALANQVQWLS
jgi:predicted nuclease of predicted toxin-antitoxin system